MADYDQATLEPQRRRPAWLWVLLALLALLLLGYALIHKSDPTTTSVTPSASASPAADITSAEQLTSATTASSLIGKTVGIKLASVTSVPGDRTFTLGEGATVTYFVLNDALNSPGNEQKVKITTGQKLDIYGNVLAAGTVADLQIKYPTMTATDAQTIMTRGFYILVNKVDQR